MNIALIIATLNNNASGGGGGNPYHGPDGKFANGPQSVCESPIERGSSTDYLTTHSMKTPYTNIEGRLSKDAAKRVQERLGNDFADGITNCLKGSNDDCIHLTRLNKDLKKNVDARSAKQLEYQYARQDIVLSIAERSSIIGKIITLAGKNNQNSSKFQVEVKPLIQQREKWNMTIKKDLEKIRDNDIGRTNRTFRKEFESVSQRIQSQDSTIDYIIKSAKF